MQNSVDANFWPITESLEGGPSPEGGNINYMFLDPSGRIATSLGIDFDGGSGIPDPGVSRAQGLSRLRSSGIAWKKVGNGPLTTAPTATIAEVEAEWLRLFNIREQSRASKDYWGVWQRFAPSSSDNTRRAQLVADPSEFRRVARQKLLINEAQIKSCGHYPDYDNWPADAQLGILLLSWDGVGFLTAPDGTPGVYRKFRNFLKKSPPDFLGAAGESGISDPIHPNNQSIARRNNTIYNLFRNAQTVADPAWQYDRSRVYWPTVILTPVTV